MLTFQKRCLAKAGPFLGLILVIALFSIPAETREFFLTYNNFKIIFTQTVIVAIRRAGHDADHRERRHRPIRRVHHRAHQRGPARSSSNTAGAPSVCCSS